MTKVLVLEDEMLIALDLELALRDLGAEDVHLATSVDEALDLLTSHEFELAVVDYHLDGGTAEPVLQDLEERGVPFLVMAGHPQPGGLAANARRWLVVAKPPSPASLRTALASIGKKLA